MSSTHRSGETSYVQVGQIMAPVKLVFGVLGTIVAGTTCIVVSYVALQNSIEKLNTKLDERTTDRWSRSDMQHWSSELRYKNSTILVPELPLPTVRAEEPK